MLMLGRSFTCLIGDARLFLAGFLGLLVGLEAMLAPVHHAHDDRSCIACDLDEIEAGIGGGALGFIERDDADLLSVGTDQSDRA